MIYRIWRSSRRSERATGGCTERWCRRTRTCPLWCCPEGCRLRKTRRPRCPCRCRLGKSGGW
uniref:Uncharacterized protein n=1 Tax=Rhizophora mucronata TaxID=61149 RepID=A0A2P2QB24_RHIMU